MEAKKVKMTPWSEVTQKNISLLSGSMDIAIFKQKADEEKPFQRCIIEVTEMDRQTVKFCFENTFELEPRDVWEAIPIGKLQELKDEPLRKFSSITVRGDKFFVTVKGHDIDVTHLCDIAFIQ